MKTIVLLLGLLGLFANLAASFRIDSTCDCDTDACIPGFESEGFPYNTSCTVGVPVDSADTDRHDAYQFQACGNASYADLSSLDGNQAQGNITNCLKLLINPNATSFVFLASHLYNNTFVPMSSYEDCWFYVGGGAGATTELMDPDDTFFVGDMDLVFAVGNSILNYGNDNGTNSEMAVCGTLPNCGLYNPWTNSYSVAPEFAFCLGGEKLPRYWVGDHGSFGHDMINLADLPIERLGLPSTTQPEAAATRRTEDKEEPPTKEDEPEELLSQSDAISYSQAWYIRCDPGEKSMAECVNFYDTYCDSAGRLQSDHVACRHDCSCMRAPQARCGYHYGFIYDCY